MRIDFVQYFIFLLLSSGLIVSNSAEADEAVGIFDIPSVCVNTKDYKCHGACADGFGLDCYYDSRSTKFDGTKSLDSQKSSCYGFYDMSVCEPCRNQFRIGDKDLSCEAFYAALNDFNGKCGKCLRKRSVYAG
jgi:hypothetical protein